MKSFTLDSLRRFISRSRKKDKHESSFKRSESFKRISIKKNYLDRSGKGRNPTKVKKNGVGSGDEKTPEQVVSNPRRESGGEALIIDYGEWIRCIQQEDKEPLPQSTSSLHSSFNVSTDSALEITPRERSPPVTPKRFSLGLRDTHLHELDDNGSGSKTDSAISVSLGRIWMDAPLTMTNAPRSLELPKPVSVIELNPNGQRAHHSLESALKDRKEDKQECSYSQMPSLSPVVFRGFSRGVHTSKNSMELLSSSKDSGFSFSVSIPRLSPVVSPNDGFFRRKKTMGTPALTSKTSCGKKLSSGVSMRRAPSACSDYRKKSRRKSKIEHRHGGNMYQVVVNRPARTMEALKLDPIIFVPPEKRKSTIKTMYEVQEVRDYCTPCDEWRDNMGVEKDDELYEVISEEPDDEVSMSRDCATPNTMGSSVDLWTTEDEDSDDLEVTFLSVCSSPVQHANYSPNCKRKPAVWKKSGQKNARYVARPIYRAPSTLRQNRKLVKKNTSMFYIISIYLI